MWPYNTILALTHVHIVNHKGQKSEARAVAGGEMV